MARPNPLDLTVCPTEESGGVSVEYCATTEILVCRFDAVSGRGTVPGPETASNDQTSISVVAQSSTEMP